MLQRAPLSRAFVINTHTGERIPVMYNPEEYSLAAGNQFAEVSVPGLPTPPIQYIRGRARVLSMELFYDTYEDREDVRRYSGRIVDLLQKDPRTQAPPVLLFVLGQFQFSCVLLEANQRFSMFLPDGTPVRASVAVRFQEFAENQVRLELTALSGAQPAVHVVAQGENLSHLAADYLGDPARWREIANANNIDDPRKLPIGATLVIPGARNS